MKAINLIMTRLTMFNARKGVEHVRLTLNEWKEAITGFWIDPNLIEKVNDPLEKKLNFYIYMSETPFLRA